MGENKEKFLTCVTEADDSNNSVACTDHVRSRPSLADSLTNKHVTTQCSFYNVLTYMQDCLSRT